jgi:hypothetical protein
MFDARRVTNIIGSIIPMMRIVDAKAWYREMRQLQRRRHRILCVRGSLKCFAGKGEGWSDLAEWMKGACSTSLRLESLLLCPNRRSFLVLCSSNSGCSPGIFTDRAEFSSLDGSKVPISCWSSKLWSIWRCLELLYEWEDDKRRHLLRVDATNIRHSVLRLTGEVNPESLIVAALYLF